MSFPGHLPADSCAAVHGDGQVQVEDMDRQPFFLQFSLYSVSMGCLLNCTTCIWLLKSVCWSLVASYTRPQISNLVARTSIPLQSFGDFRSLGAA
jgi:hypothetical protein